MKIMALKSSQVIISQKIQAQHYISLLKLNHFSIDNFFVPPILQDMIAGVYLSRS